MAITKDLINNVREEIASKIPVGSGQVFATVSAFPKSTIDAFPAAIIMVSENEVAYASTGSVDSRKVTIAFSINIYYPIQTEADQEKAEEAMGEAVSEIFRVFAVRKPLTTVDLSRIGTTPWSDTTIGDAAFRVAQVILSVSVYVDTI